MKRGFLNGDKIKQRALYPTPSPNANANSNANATTKDPRTSPANANANPKTPYTNSDARKTDHAPDKIVMTTVPSTPDADGQSEWIVLGDAKKRLLSAPGYPRALPRVGGEGVAYEVRDTEAHERGTGMGLGVFATRDIEPGALIFAERPLLVLPVNSGRLATGASDSGKLAREIEDVLAIAVGRMRVGAREAFMQLANCHKENESGPLLGIVRTNGWVVRELSVEGEDNKNAYTAVCKTAARINHSCMPNIHARFDLASFAFHVRAARGIKAGEQLLHTYCAVSLPLSGRRAALAPYAFTCACDACTRATPASDTLRRDFASRVDAYRRMSDAWVGNKAVSRGKKVDEGVVRELEGFQRALVSERLDGTGSYGVMLGVMLRLYMNAGRIVEARVLVEEMRQRQRLED